MLASDTPRPTRALLPLLPRFLVNTRHEPNFNACDATVLVQLAEAAELLQRIYLLGVSATGHLLAHASVQVETGELDQGTVAAAGWLLAELGDAAAALQPQIFVPPQHCNVQ